MRIPRIYHSGQLSSNTEVELTQEASHHLVRVLRLLLDAHIILFNGESGEYHARIVRLNKKTVTVFVDAFVLVQRESSLKIHIGQSIIKTDKMDLIIQKAVELGVERLTPLYTKYGEHKYSTDRLERRLQHWRNVAISSSEQCGRNTLMIIDDPQDITEFIGQEGHEEVRFILHPRATKKLPDTLSMNVPITLLIGPEGGLTDMEVEHAMQQGYEAVSFGPRIMRTETAAIASIAILQYLWGDLG